MNLFPEDRPAPHVLRPYQVEAVEAVLAQLTSDKIGTLLLSATGTGKTQMACEIMHRWLAARDHKARILFLAHRDELIQQAERRVSSMLGLEVEIEKAESRDEKYHAIVVGSVQTLCRPARLQSHRPDEYSLIVVDECFPAGTLVDGRPIETVRLGDRVSSFDERSGQVVTGKVTRRFVNRPRAMVRLHTGAGAIVCTAGHPFWTQRGWVGAALLSSSDVVYCTNDHHVAMRSMWGTDGEIQWTPTSLLWSLSRDQKGREIITGNPTLYDLRRASSADGKTWSGGVSATAGVLQRRTQTAVRETGFVGNHVCDESARRFGSHESEQSNLHARCEGKNSNKTPREWLARCVAALWQWLRADVATTTTRVRPRLGDGDASSYRTKGWRLPYLLQTGYRQSDPQNRRGSGWTVPFRSESKRCEARCSPHVTRVDRVEILEQGSDGTFRGVCPDGLVYNLEVEGTHTYLANGFVVHNCHHAAADGYVRILDHFTGAKRLGLTATATRADGKKLGTEWESVAYEYGLRRAIADGYLVPIRRKAIRVESLRLDDVATRAGDLVPGQVEAKVLEDEATVHAWARGIIEAAPDRKVLVFCPGVQSSIRLVECLNRYAADEGKEEIAAHLDGETETNARRQLLHRYGAGEFRILSNCGVLLEGYDEPTIDCIAMCRPTKSEGLYSQMLGRGTRLADGKTNLLVIDFTSNSFRHDIVTAIDILCDGETDEVQADTAQLLAADPALSVDQALEKARKRAEAKAQREAEEAERRRSEAARSHVKAKAHVFSFDIDKDPDSFLGVDKRAADYKGRRFGAKELTPKQLAIVAKVYPTDQSTDAGRALDRERFNALIKRVSANLCSLKQAKVLQRAGFDPSNVTFPNASKMIDALAQAGWRPSPETRARIAGLASGEREAGEEG